MKLYELFFRPDLEEAEQEQDEIAEAANLLQTGEFQVLQLAYYEWFGRELAESETDKLFSEYMIKKQVPFWARDYARRILALAEEDRLDMNNSLYHRYDREYITFVPDGVRRFWLAAFWCTFVIFGGIAVATLVAREPMSMLPPYFERSEMPEQH